ncbi:hypothetical protein CA850_32655 [Micromonospora echinospora]|nr:hypothetical protein CA850_32655 [Micromonospora echinospora]
MHGHFDDDRLVDRRHQADPVMMRLSMADAVDCGEQFERSRRWEPAFLTVRLVQRLNEIRPAITLQRDVTVSEPWVTCSVAEAERLADLLLTATERAEVPMPTEGVVDGPFWQKTACPPWCTSRHQADDAYADRVHHADLLPDGKAVIDLVLEQATEGRPEQLEVTVARHYRSTTAVIHVIKSEQTELQLTPSEARTLAAHLRQLLRTASLPADPSRLWKPLDGVTVGGQPAFPCPHRRPWCRGHSKSEIVESRQPGNPLMHSGSVASVPFTIGNSPGSIDISLDTIDGHQPQPFAYLQVVGGDGGGELDVTAIDHTIAALQLAKKLILDNPVGSVKLTADLG